MLGHRGRADTEGDGTHGRDHDRPAEPHDRVGTRRAARARAPLRPGRVPVLPGRMAGRRARRRRAADRPGRQARNPRSSWRGVAVIRFFAQLFLLQWLIRWVPRLIGWVIALVVMVAGAPVTTVAVIGFLGAWLRGWPPSRLRRAAAWSLPMTGIYLIGEAIHARTLRTVLAAPYRDWVHAWHLFDLGAAAPAFIACAPVAVPAGLYLASLAWGRRIYRIETGLAGKTATAPVIFDERQWRRQDRAPRGAG